MQQRGSEDDWFAFFSELWRYRFATKGRDPYLPSPSDIARRCEEVRWMKQLGFSDSTIANVMELDNPTMLRLKQMVERYGPLETERRLQPFLEPTEYDLEEEHGDQR